MLCFLVKDLLKLLLARQFERLLSRLILRLQITIYRAHNAPAHLCRGGTFDLDVIDMPRACCTCAIICASPLMFR